MSLLLLFSISVTIYCFSKTCKFF